MLVTKLIFKKKEALPYQTLKHSSKTHCHKKHHGTRQKYTTNQKNMRKNSYIVRVYYKSTGKVQSACILYEEK